MVTRCVILATGPSLHPDDVAAVRDQAFVIAVNDAWTMAPWSDILYACDEKWWEYHKFVPAFKGEKWTQSHGTRSWINKANRNGLYVITSSSDRGFSYNPEYINRGANSGFQALNLAISWGYTEIFLLGFDMTSERGKHFFGEHPKGLQKESPFHLFREHFDYAAAYLPANISIVNCSRHTILESFPRGKISEYFTAPKATLQS